MKTKTKVKELEDGKIRIRTTTIMKKPKSCCKCPMFSSGSYSVHNERGSYAICDLDFFDNDMRDQGCSRTFHYCQL